MKQSVIILSFILVAVLKKSNAQTVGVPDTLSYLQNLESTKQKYVGKAFSVFLDSLKIDVKYFTPIAWISGENAKETSTMFSFYFPQNEKEIYLTYPCIEIYWKSSLDANLSRFLFSSYKGMWVGAVNNFYASATISNIKVLN